MITVTYEPEAYRMTVRGHAGSAPYGYDLVCSGVSVLMLTLSRMSNLLEAAGKAEGNGIIVSGLGTLQCVPTEGNEDTVRTMLDTIAAGMELLAEEYPDYVQIASTSAEVLYPLRGCDFKNIIAKRGSRICDEKSKQ